MSTPSNNGPQDPFGPPAGTGSYGQQSAYPQQPPAYPQQPPAYPQQSAYPQQGQNPYGQPGYPAQPYGQMPPAPQTGFGANPAARPGQVTAAAVLAFVIGGLNLIGALLIFSVASVLVSGFATFWAVVALAVGAGLIFAGIQTIGGKDGRLIVILAGVGVLVQIVSLISYFVATQLIGLIIVGAIIYLMMTPQAKAWLDSKGAKHF